MNDATGWETLHAIYEKRSISKIAMEAKPEEEAT
jgi:hypothetical protein